ncbi:TB2/DP1, HVA22 family-domain-containing protein [Syncephalis fuscata]|nr:TB2/DP1, HVA22 family-domain-containing protein [Syncephalis fuscata]
MEKVFEYEAQLDVELSKIPQLVQLQEQTGVKKTYLVGGVAGVAFVLIFFNIAGGLLTNLLGFGYPAYASFKAIETAHKDDDTQWLTYWTVFGAFNVIESFVDTILYWIPFYYMVKTFALLWLYLPNFRGAETVYHTVLAPYLISHQSSIDGALNNIKAQAAAAVEELDNKEE